MKKVNKTFLFALVPTWQLLGDATGQKKTRNSHSAVAWAEGSSGGFDPKNI
jgi:hypothetical protein